MNPFQMRIKIRNHCCGLGQHTWHALLQNGQQSLFIIGVLCINTHTPEKRCIQSTWDNRSVYRKVEEEKERARWYWSFSWAETVLRLVLHYYEFLYCFDFFYHNKWNGICGGKPLMFYGHLRCKEQVGAVVSSDEVEGGITGSRYHRDGSWVPVCEQDPPEICSRGRGDHVQNHLEMSKGPGENCNMAGTAKVTLKQEKTKSRVWRATRNGSQRLGNWENAAHLSLTIGFNTDSGPQLESYH